MSERRIRIRRGGPAELRYDTFTVPVHSRTTVLDALEYIRARHDPELQYRHSCHHGSCGTCGMIVNGEQKLACLANVEEMVRAKGPDDADAPASPNDPAGEGERGAATAARGSDAHGSPETADITVEPHDAFAHLMDLAVDPTGFFDRYPENATYLRTSETNKSAPVPPEVSAEGSSGFERFENCIECGLCVSACPVTQAFVGPATLAAFHRELKNRPDRREEILGMVDTKDGVWACQRALNCSRVCPTGVYPAKHIAMLQRHL